MPYTLLTAKDATGNVPSSREVNLDIDLAVRRKTQDLS